MNRVFLGVLATATASFLMARWWRQRSEELAIVARRGVLIYSNRPTA